MSIDNDIKLFRDWAMSLCCNPKDLPNDDALKSVFKSRQRDLFCDLMKYVRPRQTVQHIKHNILIHEMEKLKNLLMLIPASQQTFMPLQLQYYIKYCHLSEKKKQTSKELDKLTKEFISLSASIKSKNVRIINMERKCELCETKLHVLKYKLRSLDKALKKEAEFKDRIKKTEPATKIVGNDKAMVVVECALEKLQIFYRLCDDQQTQQNSKIDSSHQNNRNLNEDHNHLWSNMKHLFLEIPNHMLYNALLMLKDAQLQRIIELNAKPIGDKNQVTSNIVTVANVKGASSEYDLNVLKLKSNMLVLIAKYLKAKSERENMEKEYLRLYGRFECALLDKIKLLNVVGAHHRNDKNHMEVLQKFIMEYNKQNFKLAQNEFLQQQILFLKEDIDMTQNELQHHEVMVNSAKDLYNKMFMTINRLNYEIGQLPQIKERIIYLKNKMEDNLKQYESVTNRNVNFMSTKGQKSGSNTSVAPIISSGSTNIFGSNVQGNIFCSTKLDFDSTAIYSSMQRGLKTSALGNNISACTSIGDNAADGIRTTLGNNNSVNDITLIPAAPINVTLSGSKELKAFNNLSLEFFNCIPKECQYYLMPNPLIVDINGTVSNVQLVPGILLTPFGLIKELRQCIKWANLVERHRSSGNNFKVPLKLLNVDDKTLKLKMQEQNDCISELLHNISLTIKANQHLLQKLNKLYAFLIENPLRNFIPRSKLFNNRTYYDYESEYMMYYRMATANTAAIGNADSIDVKSSTSTGSSSSSSSSTSNSNVGSNTIRGTKNVSLLKR